MASVLFGAHASLAVLPLMLFHQMQLMVCAVIAKRRARDPEATGPSDGTGPDATTGAGGTRGAGGATGSGGNPRKAPPGAASRSAVGTGTRSG